MALKPTTTPDAAASLLTELAGRYRIERELGCGGMAMVYTLPGGVTRTAHDISRPTGQVVRRLLSQGGERLSGR